MMRDVLECCRGLAEQVSNHSMCLTASSQQLSAGQADILSYSQQSLTALQGLVIKSDVLAEKVGEYRPGAEYLLGSYQLQVEELESQVSQLREKLSHADTSLVDSQSRYESAVKARSLCVDKIKELHRELELSRLGSEDVLAHLQKSTYKYNMALESLRERITVIQRYEVRYREAMDVLAEHRAEDFFRLSFKDPDWLGK